MGLDSIRASCCLVRGEHDLRFQTNEQSRELRHIPAPVRHDPRGPQGETSAVDIEIERNARHRFAKSRWGRTSASRGQFGGAGLAPFLVGPYMEVQVRFHGHSGLTLLLLYRMPLHRERLPLMRKVA